MCHDALELGNQARFWVGWVQSQVTKHQTFEVRNVAFVERTCHFVGNKYQLFIPELCQRVSTTFSFTLGDNS